MFEWDENKNRSNIEKHGIGFSIAIRIFDGPVLSWIDNRRNYGEVRHQSIGAIDGVVMVAVIHTDRGGRIRIISARQANRLERKRYEQEVRSGTQS